MKTQSINCLVCSSKSHHILYKDLRDVEDRVPGKYTISQCSKCQFVFLSKRPTEDSLAECYPHDYHARVENWTSKISTFLYTLKYYFEYRRLQKVIRFIPKSLMDVGCGSGGLLLELRRRWGKDCDLAGLDLAKPTTTDLAKAHIKLYVSDLKVFRSTKKYDVITLNEVLEHVYDPVKTLVRVRRNMKKGGLLVGEVPHLNSPWLKVFPKHWGGFQIPRHMNFFNDQSVSKVLQKAGFKVVSTGNRYSPGDLGVAMCNWVVDHISPTSRPRKTIIYLPIIVLSAIISWPMHMLCNTPCNLEFVAINE